MDANQDLLNKINSQVLMCKKYFCVNNYYEMDYLHDAFIRVVERINVNYEEKGKFDSWVRTVAMNCIRTELKRDRNRESNLCDFSDCCDIISCDTDCYALKRKIVVELAVSALATLSLEDYMMVQGRMYGKSCARIAVELNLNIKTVRKHLAKSYEKIKAFVCMEYYKHYNEHLDNFTF